MDFEAAILAHSKWKRRLKTSNEGGERIDSVAAAKSDACDLGKWIDGEGLANRGNPALKQLRDAHIQFHRAASAVVESINKGERDHANQMIATGSEFSRCSSAVISAITTLRDGVPGGRK